jgi:hypothetical protein
MTIPASAFRIVVIGLVVALLLSMAGNYLLVWYGKTPTGDMASNPTTLAVGLIGLLVNPHKENDGGTQTPPQKDNSVP